MSNRCKHCGSSCWGSCEDKPFGGVVGVYETDPLALIEGEPDRAEKLEEIADQVVCGYCFGQTFLKEADGTEKECPACKGAGVAEIDGDTSIVVPVAVDGPFVLRYYLRLSKVEKVET